MTKEYVNPSVTEISVLGKKVLEMIKGISEKNHAFFDDNYVLFTDIIKQEYRNYTKI